MKSAEEKPDLRWEILQYCMDSLESDVIRTVATDWTRFSRDEVAAHWEVIPGELARQVGEPNAFNREVPPGSLLGSGARTLHRSGLLGDAVELHPVDEDLQRELKNRAIRLLHDDMKNYAASLRATNESFDVLDDLPVETDIVEEIVDAELDRAAEKRLRESAHRLFLMFRVGMKPREIRRYFTEYEYKRGREELREFLAWFQRSAAAFGTAIFALLRRPYERATMFAARTDPAIATTPAATSSGSGRTAGILVAALLAGSVAGGVAITRDGGDVVKTPQANAAAAPAPNTLLPYGELKAVPEKKKPRKKARKKPPPAPVRSVPQYVPPATSRPASGSGVDDGSAEFLPEYRGGE